MTPLPARFETLEVSRQGTVCTARINRPDAGNAINAKLVEELGTVLDHCEDADGTPPVSVLVLEGSSEVFCAGGDFDAAAAGEPSDPGPLYDLWLRLAAGPFVAVSVVRGRANAGGIGFVAASDIVLADRAATFSLSELLFGLYPACVLPFLTRRIGAQRARYMALMTRPFGAEEALRWGLADGVDTPVDALLRSHLARLQRLDRPAIGRFKRYLGDIADDLERIKPKALAANRALFADPEVQRNIRRYVTEMKLPWED